MSAAAVLARDEALEGDAGSQMFLSFVIGEETYAVHIGVVMEIIGLQRITPIPNAPHYIRGVINLRGKVVPLMDVRARFGFPSRDYDARTCIIVVRVDAIEIGLLVDTVREVVDIPAQDIEPAPRMMGGTGGFIEGMGKVGDAVVILLDAPKLLQGQAY
jgi:purine-binding chemotaxis protein CheW